MAAIRIRFAPDRRAPPLACVHCGQIAVRVADFLDEDDNVVGTGLVCTACQAHPRRNRDGDSR